ncbi:MAG TPA: PAS domain-containing protein, partial [Flavisolibacter sp.]
MFLDQVATPRFEAFIQEQGEVLQMITQGKPLPLILERLVRWIESQAADGLLASVLILDAEGKHLRHGAAPSLPSAYNTAIDGIVIGPRVGSCGTAAFTKQTVIVENILTDPLWEEFRELALTHNLQACWSTPLIGSDGAVKGTFAIYYPEPKKPSPDDLHMITLVSQIALMAIEFRNAEEERRKRAEKEQRNYQKVVESESNFRNLVMKAPVGICIVKAGSLIVETVNDAFLELVGKTRAEFENRPYWETLKEAEPIYGPVLNKVIETGVPHVAREAEVTLVRKGKAEVVYVSFVYDPIVENDGRVEKVMLLGIEVSDQVLARKEVEKSEQQVRSLVASAPFPIGVYEGKEMRIRLANQSIIDVWGKGPDVIGKLYTELLPELQNQKIFQQVDSVFETGKPFHAKNQRVDIEVEGQLKSFYFNYSFTPVFDSEGKVFAVMNTAADVTDLNEAHMRIEESEKNLRNIIIQAPVAMCILRGPDYVVDIANDRMFELWGRPGKELLGKPIFEGLPEAAGQGFEALLQKVYDTGETFSDFGVPINLPREGV